MSPRSKRSSGQSAVSTDLDAGLSQRLLEGLRGRQVVEVAHHLPVVEAWVVDVDRLALPATGRSRSRRLIGPAGAGARSEMPSSRSWRSSTGAGAPVSGSRAGGGLREGDHVADRVGAVQQRDDAVEAVGDPAVRRGAVAQRLEQEAEPLLGLRVAIPSASKTCALHVGVADADRAAADLPAVPDDVVGQGPRRARVVGSKLARRAR